jgi:hypothetical protein
MGRREPRCIRRYGFFILDEQGPHFGPTDTWCGKRAPDPHRLFYNVYYALTGMGPSHPVCQQCAEAVRDHLEAA